ncbi:MAG: hypothetical protein M1827_004373 [Pycnora praestabilis]|nr:MAG: hypothetical protein M1827_004373 [Pycnora praestabilis]
MFLFACFHALVLSCLAIQSTGLGVGGKPSHLIKPYKRAPLQDIVTWDEHSVFVRGERVLLYNGEFHPFRLPVPGLWLDIFQKIKALGFSGVSFYSDWALLEGKQGNFSAEGIFDFKPFFAAASEAGIYLVARPGPYINAEASGGGYPGWLQRIRGKLRENDADYINATTLYTQSIGNIIAEAQITNGGPVILVQPENEYSQATHGTEFPDPVYFQTVEDQFRNAGIIVPFVSNDAAPHGYFAPGYGSGEGDVDIYGHDGYPLGFDCANPYTWPDGALPTTWRTLHLEQSPTTPYTLSEFQGGSFDPWGGSTFAKCAELLNEEFERVFYKNDYSFGVTIFSIYMVYGGTNWGNLGHPGGYTSYDYGAPIAEDRTITREKYSEVKLEATFLMASLAYLTAVPGNATNGSYTDSAVLAVTPLFGNVTSFWVLRHAAYNTLDSTNYKLIVPTSAGMVTIPQLNGTLTLNGRDSKIHVTDYDVGGTNLLYSSAEIFTWKSYGSKTVLILYGGPGEQHEAAFVSTGSASVIEGSGVTTAAINESIILNWQTTSNRKVVQIQNDLFVYILDRNEAYNYWVLDLPSNSTFGNFTSRHTTSMIVKAGYLLRTATAYGSSLFLTGDLNITTPIEVIGGAPAGCSSLFFNRVQLNSTQDNNNVISATASYISPNISIPSLSALSWKYVDSLPEIQPTYSDTLWTLANLTTSNNPRNLTTPMSLYASDYGYNTGALLYRGHFTSTGSESSIFLHTQGGYAFGTSVWLNSTFIGSWVGIDADEDYNGTFTLPNLAVGQPATLTVLIDNMGLDESGTVGTDEMKNPRGILDYDLSGRPDTAITWKVTGNLGGEDYRDRTRGPLNEGGLFAERQGYHLPNPPSADWMSRKPTQGMAGAGVEFYTTSFELSMPYGYDVPLSFAFSNSTANGTNVPDYRVQLYVNGYQFGKYVNKIGPQTTFPVPEGILNYHGTNYIALSLWALGAGGAAIEDLQLVAGYPVQSGFGEVTLAPMPAYAPRAGAY